MRKKQPIGITKALVLDRLSNETPSFDVPRVHATLAYRRMSKMADNIEREFGSDPMDVFNVAGKHKAWVLRELYKELNAAFAFGSVVNANARANATELIIIERGWE